MLVSRCLLLPLFLLVTAALHVPLPAQVSWGQATPSAVPPARANHVMVHDPVRGRTVLFGGWQAGTALGDTWEWNGEDWVQKFPATSPPARWNAAACWDPVRQRVVLFGGERAGPSYFGDTWEWDGTNWFLLATTGPSGRSLPGMAFDHVNGAPTLAGGGRHSTRFRDMWSFSGGSWRAVSAGTLPRPAQEMVFCSDPDRGQILWNGGWDGNVINETWIWDGSSWTRASSDRGGYGQSAAAYDPVRRRIVAFGGNRSDHTWEWTGTEWIRRGMWLEPNGRSGSALAYDTVEGRMLLFGGVLGNNRPQSDTWEYFHFTPAAAQTYGSGCVASTGTTPRLAIRDRLLPWIDETWTLEITDIPGTPSNAVFGLVGSSDLELNGRPLLPLDLALIGAPGCSMLTNGDDDAVTLVNRAGAAEWNIAFPLDLRLVELLALSACESNSDADGELDDELDGPLGLAAAGLAAGARRVLATTSEISDEATRRLVGDFYRQWEQGRTPAEALREARRLSRQRGESVWKHVVLLEAG